MFKAKESDITKAFFKTVFAYRLLDPRWERVVGFPHEYPFSEKNKNSIFTWLSHLKVMGQPKDFPDIFVFHAVGKFHGLAIEVKRKGNKPRKGQYDWLNRLQWAGYRAVWIDTDNPSDLLRIVERYFDGKPV